MSRRFAAVLAVVVATLVADRSAHSITHTSEYRTNMGNYRVCTDPALDTCTYEEVLSPSKFYLSGGTTTTVVHKDDGTVQLRIDAGGILTDTGIDYPCGEQLYPCVGNKCVGGHNNTSTCNANRCHGGSNAGAPCPNDSACPGGTCSDGTACSAFGCQGGPRDDLECSYAGNPTCSSVANTGGWNVVFRGNHSSFTYQAPNFHYLLQGDGESGCMKVCAFTLGSTGAINSAGLSCSKVGSCNPLEVFHYVEIRDPDGEVVAVPTIGPAYIITGNWAIEGDPAQVGDCTRPSNAAFCP